MFAAVCLEMNRLLSC